MKRLVLVCLALSACDTATDAATGGPCTQDFECTVGQVCEIASGDTEGVCTDATSGATRNFGQASLDFSGGSEAYLVSVFALPRAESAANDLTSFTLTAGDASASALKLRHGTAEHTPTAIELERSQFESARRAQIDALVDALNDGRIRRDSPVRQSSGCSPACGDDTMCWQSECVSDVDLTLTAGGPTVSAHLVTVVDGLVNVLVDSDAITDDAGVADVAQAAAEKFASTFPRELGLLGFDNTDPTDRDGDGRFTVVFTNATANGVPLTNVGFFDPGDFLTTGTSGASGNEADLLWVRVPGTSIGGNDFTELYAVGTLAHEYMHLASFSVRVWSKSDAALRETLWLDEGMAHAMEDLTGWGTTSVANIAAALGSWADAALAGPDDTDGQRGKAMMLIRYLIDRQAEDAGANDAADAPVQTAATGLFTGLLNEAALGWQHSAFQGLGSGGYAQWLLAVYATNNSEVTETDAHAGDYLPTGTDGDTDNAIGIDTHGTLPDMRGDDVELEGPEYDEVSDTSSPTESEVLGSGAVYFLVTGGTGTVLLTGNGDAQVDMHVEAARVQ